MLVWHLEIFLIWVFPGYSAENNKILPNKGNRYAHRRLRGAIGSASDSRSEGCVFKSRRGHTHFGKFFSRLFFRKTPVSLPGKNSFFEMQMLELQKPFFIV